MKMSTLRGTIILHSWFHGQRIARPVSAFPSVVDITDWMFSTFTSRLLIRAFRSCVNTGPAGLAVFLRYLNSDRRTETETELFGTMSLRRILGYRWHDYMSNDLVLRQAGLGRVSCKVRERQLRLGHVARRPAEDLALQKCRRNVYAATRCFGVCPHT